ncbi:MAG: hypothetical protein B7Y95_17825 [Rhizobiales bacterium 32-66-11]|nr:MAG: hypothetical protein B7Y95_17825 [Rhizobiales bacterium 32-66-11]
MTMPNLVITNGDAAVERLKAGGIAGHFLPWRDMLHDGPVPADASLATVADARAAFLSQSLGLEFDSVRADFPERDGQLEIHIAFNCVDLWFEHDLYDQLQLIQLLNYFAREPERLGLRLIQADHYLGLMDEAQVHDLAQRACGVSAVQLETASDAWEAFTAPTPRALARFVKQQSPALPFLVPALRRALAELPAPRTGLSLTEERILRQLVDGPQSVAHVYGAVHKMDEAQFLADLPFFLRLDGLAFAHEPLIEGLPFASSECKPFQASTPAGPEEITYRTFATAEIALTEAGHAALKGGFDHACENAIDRWLGGTRLQPGAMWRYDRNAERLIDPN